MYTVHMHREYKTKYIKNTMKGADGMKKVPVPNISKIKTAARESVTLCTGITGAKRIKNNLPYIQKGKM